MDQKFKVADVGQIPAGQSRLCKAGALEVVVHHSGESYYATEPLCPHRGGSLAEGYRMGADVICKLHGWQFDVTTGCSTNIPNIQLKTYPVSVEGSEIYVTLAAL